MDLPIPLIHGGKCYRKIDVRVPSPSVIADTAKIAKAGNYYFSIQTFIAGCVERLEAEDGADIVDRAAIRTAIADLPWRSADYVSIQIMLNFNKEDGIEGVYECPRCHAKQIAEVNDRLGIDTRDFISQLEVLVMSGVEDGFTLEFDNPLEVQLGQQQEVLKTLKFAHPTLKDCVRAYGLMGDDDSVRLQLQVYVECIREVNGKEVDHVYRKKYGMMLMERMNLREHINKITEALTHYGIETSVVKRCHECSKEWRAEINTANFFVSGLR